MKSINKIVQNRLNPISASRHVKSVIPARRAGVALSMIVGLTLLAMAGITNATILAYEPFNYSVGGIDGGTASTATGTPTATTGGGFLDWFAASAGNTIVNGLAYPGLQTTNNALQWSTSVEWSGENLATAILPATTPSVYVSFLYNAPSYTANKSGFALDNGAASNQGYYMGMTASGVFGVATVDNGSGTVLGTASETISFNTTYFVVVKFEKDAAGTYYKSGSIWINPTPGASEPAASGTFTGTYTVMNKIADFLTAMGGSAVMTDEIRLGTTWADVTPSNGGSTPGAPTALQVDSSGDNTVSLSWTASTGDPDSYNVKRATSSGGTYTTIGTTTAPTVSYTDSLTGGATYYYAVSAVNAGGESADSSFVSATPTLGVPDAPTGLAATPSDNQVALTWIAPVIGSPTSYNVLRSTTSGSNYSAITTPGAQTTTSYTDSTAVNGTTYYYVVTAENATGASSNSTQVSATPAAYTGAYEPFNYPIENNLDNGTAATGTGFTGNWTCGVSGWILSGMTYPDLPVANNALRSPLGRQSVSLENPISSGTKWVSFLYTTSVGNPGANINGVYFPNGGTGLWFGFGLAPASASQGYFGLGSMNTVGTTVQSATELTQLGLGTYGDTYLVAMKIEFDTSGNNDTVTVYVNPTANQVTPGVTAAGSYSSFDVGTISGIGMNVSGGGENFIDEIRFAETYADVVAAVTTPPDTPTGLNATSGTNLVSLSWTAAVSGGLPTGYNVKRSSSFGGPYTTVGSTTVPTVTYDDSILGGSTYYYVVSAVNGIGESTNSTQVYASPTIAAPDTPSGLSATAGDSQVSLSWSASTFATSYTVKRATDIAGPYSTIGTTTAPTVTYDDVSGLLNGTTYYYVVSATGAGGESADTTPESAMPFGPMPLVLSIDQGVGITWFASNSVTYHVQWSSEDLGTNTVWSNVVSSITGDGTTNTVFDPDAGPPHNIYQVISTY